MKCFSELTICIPKCTFYMVGVLIGDFGFLVCKYIVVYEIEIVQNNYYCFDVFHSLIVVVVVAATHEFCFVFLFRIQRRLY